MLILLAFAFLAGIVTILSPCILPILPIVLSGTVGGSKRKPIGIIIGFVISFTFFTLFLTKIVQLTGIPSNSLRIIAGIVLLLFGLSLFIPKFQVFMERLFSKLSVFAPKANPNAGFWGGFIIGISIGIIWTPCVGPILASVIALAATSTVTTVTFLITLFYSIGSAIPMFIIMYGGRNLLNKAPWLTRNGDTIQKAFGILMIVLALAIFTNLDQQFEAYIASTPYGANLTRLEDNAAVTDQLNQLKNQPASESIENSGLFNTDVAAPDFIGINKWLNTDKQIHIADLKGKVVLVDFWTYTCINCIRTLPHVTSWYDKYKDKGFVVIGVHTPEFQFEHETANVENAIQAYKIHYPVAQDNDYATWNNYHNEYWPAEYLIDAKGHVRRTHFGESEYDQMEEAIQVLLKDAGAKVDNKIEDMPDQTPRIRLSPETYLGTERMEYYDGSGSINDGKQNFKLANPPGSNSFSFGGEWDVQPDKSTTGKNARLNYHFYADKVFLVLRPGTNKNAVVKVLLDGKPVSAANAGADDKNGSVSIDTDRLYNLIDLHGNPGDHILELQFQNSGVESFAFTFG